jgi:hypothetical protein
MASAETKVTGTPQPAHWTEDPMADSAARIGFLQAQ